MMYTADVVKIFERQGLSAHQYGNNIQVYSRCRPTDSMLVCHDLGSCIKHVASWMDTNRCKDGIHMVRSTTSASSVSIRSTCSWLCSGDTSRLSMQHVNEVARYQAPVHVLRHPSTDLQHQTIGSWRVRRCPSCRGWSPVAGGFGMPPVVYKKPQDTFLALPTIFHKILQLVVKINIF